MILQLTDDGWELYNIVNNFATRRLIPFSQAEILRVMGDIEQHSIPIEHIASYLYGRFVGGN